MNRSAMQDSSGKPDIVYVSGNTVEVGEPAHTHVMAIVDGLRDRGYTVRLIAVNYHGKRPGIVRRLAAILCIQLRALLRLLAARLLRKPTVLYVRYHPFTPLPTVCARMLRIPSMLEVNGALDDFVEIWHPPKPVTSIVLKTIAPCLRAASTIIAVAEELADHVHEGFGIERDKLHVVDNGVNTALFKPLDTAECRKKLGLKEDARIVTFVGTLSVYQGLDTLLDACEQLAQAKEHDILTLIVGDGALRPDVEKTISEKNLQHCVTLVGRVPLENVPLYVCAGDVCVAPFAECVSTAGGFSPLKVYEYMACAKVVVASDFSCFSSVLSGGPCGLVTEPGNSTALTQAVLRLLENPAEAEQMGRRGRELVEERFTWDIATDKIVDIMAELTTAKKGS